MSINYAKKLPRDGTGEPMTSEPAPFTALATNSSENGTTSSVISLTHDTTIVEVAASGASAFVKWITTGSTNPSVISAAGTANFDHSIPTNSFRRFVVPVESGGIANSVVGINRGAGLYQRIAVKTAGNASVMTTEY